MYIRKHLVSGIPTRVGLFSLILLIAACGGGGGGSSPPPVTPTNTTPVANAGADQAVSTGTTVTLNGNSSSDADGDTLLYSWSLTSSPAGSSASISNSAEIIASITVDEVGDYVISLVVNDGSVNSTADSLTIMVTEYSGSGSITTGLGTATVNNLFPSGVRPSPLGSIQDLQGGTWAVPAEVNFQDGSFPIASDLHNTYNTGADYPTEIAALAALDPADIVEVDASGELITAYVFADNYFELYINGVGVGKDPVPFTEFNSNLIQFRVEVPFTAAMLLVDWEENLGTGTESNGGQNTPGDGGVVAVFKDSTDGIIGITGSDWRAQTYYTAPVDNLSCLTEIGTQRLSSTCSTSAVANLANVYAVHWALDANWMDEGFDDSLWPTATTYTNTEVGVNNRDAYNNFTNVFDDATEDAEFIWSTNLDLDNQVVVRKVIGD
jgi:hypothetical protein